MNIILLLENVYVFIQNLLSYITGGTNCLSCGIKCLALPLCKKCKSLISDFKSFSIVNRNRCSACGKILLSEISVCNQCRNLEKPRIVKEYFPLHSYRLWKKDLMYYWKSKNVRSLSLFFANLIYKALIHVQKERNLSFDCIVPVPPRKGKIKKKGWDQIDELCKILSSKYKVKIANLLVRYDSREQKKKNREERKDKNGAEYGLKKGENRNFNKVLLLDDVITTGSTMEKCAQLLKNGGIDEIYGMSLFIVD